jgi:alkylhydroperoxidase family enzyme
VTALVDERDALALAEGATRLSDRADSPSVSDEIWEEAARHYDEPALAALITEIALINAWNRLTAITWQPAGSGPG